MKDREQEQHWLEYNPPEHRGTVSKQRLSGYPEQGADDKTRQRVEELVQVHTVDGQKAEEQTGQKAEELLAKWLIEAPSATALFLDFDGTMSEIVPDPANAKPLPGVPDMLNTLSVRLALVAVVSGRSLSFLQEQLDEGKRVGVPAETGKPAGWMGQEQLDEGKRVELPEGITEEWGSNLVFAGSYGLELSWAGATVIDSAITPWEDKIRQAHEEVVKEGLSNVFIEDKGIGFALHWRSHPEESARALEVATRVATTYGLELQPGKMAIELRAPVHIDKGSTVLKLVNGQERVCYIGDDEGDLKAYDTLDILESQYNSVVQRVAVDSPEIPAELYSRADLVLEGPASLARVLAIVVDSSGLSRK